MDISNEFDGVEFLSSHHGLIKATEQVATDLRELLTNSTSDNLNADEMDSFADLDPVEFRSSFSMTMWSDTEAPPLNHTADKPLMDKHFYDGIVQNGTTESAIDSTDLAIPLEKLLNLLKNIDVSKVGFIADDYIHVCRLNEKLLDELASLKELRSFNPYPYASPSITCAIKQDDKEFRCACRETMQSSDDLAVLEAGAKSASFILPKPQSRFCDLNKTDVFEYLEKVCDENEVESQRLLGEIKQVREEKTRIEESLKSSRNSNSTLQSQLDIAEGRCKTLETASSEVFGTLRNTILELGYIMTNQDLKQIAACIGAWVHETLAVHPWIRSFNKSDISEPIDALKDPYQLLREIGKELSDKTRALTATRSFIDDLVVEIKDLKTDRARLHEELEKKELAIQKLRRETLEKDIKVEKYRTFFENLFEPRNAAEFSKQVAERWQRCGGSSGRLSPVKSIPSDSFLQQSQRKRQGEAESGSHKSAEGHLALSVANRTQSTTLPALEESPVDPLELQKENDPKSQLFPKSRSPVQLKRLLREQTQTPITGRDGNPAISNKPIDVFPENSFSGLQAKRIKTFGIQEIRTPISATEVSGVARDSAITQMAPQPSSHSRSTLQPQRITENVKARIPETKPVRFLTNEKDDPGCPTM